MYQEQTRRKSCTYDGKSMAAIQKSKQKRRDYTEHPQTVLQIRFKRDNGFMKTHIPQKYIRLKFNPATVHIQM